MNPKVFKPDKYQQAFLDAFDENLQSYKDDFLILTGDAGTGKTELILELIKICEEKHIYTETTAFTGRAAAVLKDRGVKNALTVDKWLGSLQDLLLLKNYADNEAFVLIIDESSMLSNGYEIYDTRDDNESLLLDEIIFTFFKHIPNDKKFIVFVGDDKQLPPIVHNYSPALDQLYLEYRYSIKGKTFVLERPHRQEEKHDINKFASFFEHSESSLSKELAIPEKKYFEEVLNSNQVQFISQDEVAENFFFHYFDDPNSVKIITPTNQKADLYNFDIKKRLYSSSNTNFQPHNLANNSLEISKGDILQVFENREGLYEQNIFNGQFLVVNEPLDVYDIVFHRGNKPDVFSRFPVLYQKVNVSFISDSGIISNENFEIIISIDFLVDSYQLNKEEFEYFNSKESGVTKKIIENLTDRNGLNWGGAYFDKKINPILCKFGYSLTGHKAQGGGWDYIFLDLEHFWSDNGHVSPKWVYTSAKRAKKKLYLINY